MNTKQVGDILTVGCNLIVKIFEARPKIRKANLDADKIKREHDRLRSLREEEQEQVNDPQPGLAGKTKERIRSSRPWSQIVDDPVMDQAIKVSIYNPSLMQ